jgi:hypothetical protein
MAITDYPTLDERMALCEAKVTLNGKPAWISGARLRFAAVTDRKTGLSAEWAWPTVARIVARDGAFES